MEMTKGELDLHFKNLNSSIEDIKTTTHTIEKRQEKHFESIIHLDKDVEFLKKDMENHKKNVRWGIGLVMPSVTAGILFVANFFITKQS